MMLKAGNSTTIKKIRSFTFNNYNIYQALEDAQSSSDTCLWKFQSKRYSLMCVAQNLKVSWTHHVWKTFFRKIKNLLSSIPSYYEKS